MRYLKCLFINFLAVFFVDYLLPGIEIIAPTKLPQLNGDILFPLVVGLLNSLIVPILKGTQVSLHWGKMALIAFAISFGAYAVLKLASLSVEISSFKAYLIASLFVAAVSIFTNLLEIRHSSQNATPPPEMPLL